MRARRWPEAAQVAADELGPGPVARRRLPAAPLVGAREGGLAAGAAGQAQAPAQRRHDEQAAPRVMAPARLAPRQQLGGQGAAQRLVEVVAAEHAPVERVGDGRDGELDGLGEALVALGDGAPEDGLQARVSLGQHRRAVRGGLRRRHESRRRARVVERDGGALVLDRRGRPSGRDLLGAGRERGGGGAGRRVLHGPAAQRVGRRAAARVQPLPGQAEGENLLGRDLGRRHGRGAGPYCSAVCDLGASGISVAV